MPEKIIVARIPIPWDTQIKRERKEQEKEQNNIIIYSCFLSCLVLKKVQRARGLNKVSFSKYRFVYTRRRPRRFYLSILNRI